ncbi:MAG: hypothetical protein LBS99_06415, partial [Clostridiales bacterium]|jgi:hypothetical protein|nr:hypothetical protein [Clostridiales bacterium]
VPVVTVTNESGNLTGLVSPTPVTVTFENDCSALLYKDGKLVGVYESGTIIDADGEYEITVTDLAGNVTEITFMLDTAPPTAELVGVANGGSTSGAVIVRSPSEPATVEVYFNGSLIAYTLGESLTQIGAYRVVLTDEAGNAAEYTFGIVYSVNTAGTVVIVVLIISLIGGGLAVYLFRKRGKFKRKK